MASSSGASSGSSLLPNSGSEEDLQALMRKRKRMQSNRESARRSRMRKQKLLDDLTAQIVQLTRDKGNILAALRTATQNLAGVDAENSVLTTQMLELGNRLQSLTEILHYISCGVSVNGSSDVFDDGSMKQWGMTMASADMFQYC